MASSSASTVDHFEMVTIARRTDDGLRTECEVELQKVSYYGLSGSVEEPDEELAHELHHELFIHKCNRCGHQFVDQRAVCQQEYIEQLEDRLSLTRVPELEKQLAEAQARIQQLKSKSGSQKRKDAAKKAKELGMPLTRDLTREKRGRKRTLPSNDEGSEEEESAAEDVVEEVAEEAEAVPEEWQAMAEAFSGHTLNQDLPLSFPFSKCPGAEI